MPHELQNLRAAATVAALSALSTACTPPGVAQEALRTPPARQCPQFEPWTGPYGGVPPWDKVKAELFSAAFTTGLALLAAEVDVIATSAEPPTFANTVAALQDAGRHQSRAETLFSVLKDLPGARLIPSVTDPLQRTGVGIQFDDEAWRTLFLFDRDSGALLGTRSIGKKEVPGRTIEDWNLTVESGRTDTAPATVR